MKMSLRWHTQKKEKREKEEKNREHRKRQGNKEWTKKSTLIERNAEMCSNAEMSGKKNI